MLCFLKIIDIKSANISISDPIKHRLVLLGPNAVDSFVLELSKIEFTQISNLPGGYFDLVQF